MKRKLCSLLLLLGLCAALVLPAFAQTDPGVASNVVDIAGLLTREEYDALEEKALRISEQYHCMVYIVTVLNYQNYDPRSVEYAAETIYRESDLGWGEDHTGILLLLSMKERDYDLCAYGDWAHYAYTDYGKEKLADQFLDNFREDDWYGGFSDYLDYCAVMMEKAAAGNPLDVGSEPVPVAPVIAGCFGVSFVVALIVCLVLRGSMKSVKEASAAGNYVKRDGVRFTRREDRYLTTTHSRVYSPVNKSGGSGGGTTINSGGFSHSSGKF